MSNPRRTIARVFRWMARGNGVLFLALILAGCMNHYVLHPRYPPENAKTWREEIVDGDLQMRLEWVRPAGPAPLPVVIVHPEAGHPAEEMRGVLHDLANAGYLAVAADYRRRNRGRWRESLIPWRDPADPGRVISRVRAHPDADPQRIGLLGFSQGGVFSLLIAAYDRRAAAVVAYYPVTDFETWLSAPGAGRGRRMVFRFIRAGFRRASGARSDAELDTLLRHASPMRQVETMEAPVLLVHGDRDRSAGVEESRRLAQRLTEMQRPVELLIIPGAGHVFNFRDRDQARIAWDATLAFLDRHVRSLDSSAESLHDSRFGKRRLYEIDHVHHRAGIGIVDPVVSNDGYEAQRSSPARRKLGACLRPIHGAGRESDGIQSASTAVAEDSRADSVCFHHRP